MFVAAYSRHTERAARAYLARKAAEQRAIEQQAGSAPEPEPAVEEAATRPAVTIDQESDYSIIELMAKAAFDEYIETGSVCDVLKEQRIPSSAIIRAACDGTGVSYKEVIGQNRTHRVHAVREKAICAVAVMTDLSLSRIGRYFGGRDHTTILHTLQKNGIRRPERPEKRTLAPEDIETIIQLRSDGFGKRRLAREFRLSEKTINKIAPAIQAA